MHRLPTLITCGQPAKFELVMFKIIWEHNNNSERITLNYWRADCCKSFDQDSSRMDTTLGNIHDSSSVSSIESSKPTLCTSPTTLYSGLFGSG